MTRVMLACALLLAGCGSAAKVAPGTVAVTIASATGSHRFVVDLADTAAKQQRGLMYRTAIPADGGMLFAPYPPKDDPDGTASRAAVFWMKNTPRPLDIVFIRPDRTIARIAENAVPFSEEPVASGEAVAAVLEIDGGRAAALGIAEGDRVSW